MMTMTIQKKMLPERTIGRLGHDFFSSSKDLTVIMIAMERFSTFKKAIDDLHKSIDVPFNLIIVEGNAPQSVRQSLERHQRKYKNTTIIYSDHQTTIGGAFNLAIPHLKTKYAFLMNNEMLIPHGMMSKLIQFSEESHCGIVCSKNYTATHEEEIGEQANHVNEKRSFQIMNECPSFLMSHDAINKLGKFDENTTPHTIGIDICMTAAKLGITISDQIPVCDECENEHLVKPMDESLYSFQWDEERIHHSQECLEKKWGIHFEEKDCKPWLESKKRDLADSKSFLFYLLWLISRLKFLDYDRERVRLRNFLFA